MTCRRCQSTKIIEDARITDFAHGNVKKNLSVHIKTTDKIFFNQFEQGELLAQICGSCGHVELKIRDPQALWEAYQKRL
ncbi:hypothetical protein [Croceiramulus getboli]|nr:hypothetical protein P8624_09195 [Flavobacteriaceae bacterium YJPT1-3]